MQHAFQAQELPQGCTRLKTIEMTLPDENGADQPSQVDMCLSDAPQPHFIVPLPTAYISSWNENRAPAKLLGAQGQDVKLADGYLHAASYEQAVQHLVIVARNYLVHQRGVKMRKCICLNVELQSAQRRGPHTGEAGRARVLVGIRSGIYWQVDGRYYAWNGVATRGPDEQPGYADLTPVDLGASTIAVPYTREAWATIQEIENILERAVCLLSGLADSDKAPKLLAQGIDHLLHGTPGLRSLNGLGHSFQATS